MCQLNLHIAVATLSMLYLINFLSSHQSRADNKHQVDIKVILIGSDSINKVVNCWVNPRRKDIPKLEFSL